MTQNYQKNMCCVTWMRRCVRWDDGRCVLWWMTAGALLQICRWHYSSDVSLVLEKTCHTLDKGPSWLSTSCLWSSVKAGVGSLFHHDWGSFCNGCQVS